jgi:hypothetical protein
MHESGLPATQAKLIEYLQQWCENKFGDQPATSTFKLKIRKLYEALQRSDEN